jgi:hypothetical protein
LKNVFLEVGILHGCTGTFLGKVGGMQVLADLVSSSQTVGSLSRVHRLAKAGWNNSVKSEFGEFASMEKYTYYF